MQHDILGLDVPVHDVMTVGIVQRRCHRSRHLEGIVKRQLLLSLEPTPQRFAFHVGHDVVQDAARLPRVV